MVPNRADTLKLAKADLEEVKSSLNCADETLRGLRTIRRNPNLHVAVAIHTLEKTVRRLQGAFRSV